MDEIQIDVLGPISEGEMKELVASEEFNRPFNEYERDCWDRFTSGLTDSERGEVEVWWSGKPGADFWQTVSKPAHRAINCLISYGLG